MTELSRQIDQAERQKRLIKAAVKKGAIPTGLYDAIYTAVHSQETALVQAKAEEDVLSKAGLSPKNGSMRWSLSEVGLMREIDPSLIPVEHRVSWESFLDKEEQASRRRAAPFRRLKGLAFKGSASVLALTAILGNGYLTIDSWGQFNTARIERDTNPHYRIHTTLTKAEPILSAAINDLNYNETAGLFGSINRTFPDGVEIKQELREVLATIGDMGTLDDEIRRINSSIPEERIVRVFQGRSVTFDTFRDQQIGLHGVLREMADNHSEALSNIPADLVPKVDRNLWKSIGHTVAQTIFTATGGLLFAYRRKLFPQQ